MILSYFLFCFSIVYVTVWALIEINFFLDEHPCVWMMKDVLEKIDLTNSPKSDNL